MIDLSNNNAVGHDFKAVYAKAGQRRVYLKRCQGVHYVDRTYPELRSAALAARLHVGAYDFLEPLAATPAEAARYFLELLTTPLHRGKDLRPCLDVEQGTPSARVGEWVTQVAAKVAGELGCAPVIYGGGWYLESCAFARPPGPLWLAAYGRDDGREYPVGKLPHPWTSMAAHQFTSKAHVVGIHGLCDLSHVFEPAGLELPAPAV
jgi:GH25 family lysozyme M1 (1,4-beta-N-acetylmuramidase)